MATACDMLGLEGCIGPCHVLTLYIQCLPSISLLQCGTPPGVPRAIPRPAGHMILAVSNLLQLVWLAIWQAFKTNMHAIAWSQHCPCCCRSQEDLHAHCCCCMCVVTWIFLPVALRFVLPDRWLQLMVAAWQLIMT